MPSLHESMMKLSPEYKAGWEAAQTPQTPEKYLGALSYMPQCDDINALNENVEDLSSESEPYYTKQDLLYSGEIEYHLREKWQRESKIKEIAQTTIYNNYIENSIYNYNPDISHLPETSIFRLNEWPIEGIHQNIKPIHIYNILYNYTTTIKSIDSILREFKVGKDTFYKVRKLFPEVQTAWDNAHREKAHEYGQKANELYQGEVADLPDDEFEETKYGKRLQMSAVRYRENKHTAMLRHAQIHETGSFIPKAVTENTNRNLNVQATPEDLAELLNSDPLDLSKSHDSKRLNNRQ